MAAIAQAVVVTGQDSTHAVLGGAPAMGSDRENLVVELVTDFTAEHSLPWAIVNDGVMGGRSRSSFVGTRQSTALFSGTLSLENNGGFASTRARLETNTFSGSDGVIIRVRGDGRSYQLRLRMDGRFDGIAYQAAFATEPDEWTEIVLPFESFLPTLRGSVPRRAALLNPSRIRQLGFLLGDKLEGPFRLEVDWVKAYQSSHDAAPSNIDASRRD
jgi:monofunctional biosynthetic peptidoglycan transglycosylase